MYVELTASDPAEVTPYPVAVEAPELSERNHLSYAVQWFIFSLCAIVGWVFAVRKSAEADAVQSGPVIATGWWARNISEPGKLPLLLCFAAFIVTFMRRARSPAHPCRPGRSRTTCPEAAAHASRGPRHHPARRRVVARGQPRRRSPWREIAAVAIGMGASLVLDEFALILHLTTCTGPRKGGLGRDGQPGLRMHGAGADRRRAVRGRRHGGGRAGRASRRDGGMVLNVGLVLVNVLKGKVRLACSPRSCRSCRRSERSVSPAPDPVGHAATTRHARTAASGSPASMRAGIRSRPGSSNLVAGGVSTDTGGVAQSRRIRT